MWYWFIFHVRLEIIDGQLLSTFLENYKNRRKWINAISLEFEALTFFWKPDSQNGFYYIFYEGIKVFKY